MRIPYSLQGILFGPILVGLTVILKVFCPAAAGEGCFVDSLALPVFLPLVFIYKIIGGSPTSYELLLVIVYWSLVGLLIGLILDLCTHRSEYLPESHLPPSQTSVPVSPPQSPEPRP